MQPRVPFSTLLVGLNVGLLLLAIAGVAVIAVRLLRTFADEQALARVAQAGASAQTIVSRSGESLAVDAHLLAERPTLLRLIAAGEAASLQAFLDQFRQTSQLTASAVMEAGVPIAQAGLPLDWAALWAAHGRDPDYYLVARADGLLFLGAWATLAAQPEATVGLAVQLDEAFARRIEEEVDLPVRLMASPAGASAELPEAGVLASLRAEAVSGQPVAAQLGGPDKYVAIVPLQEEGGPVVGLIEIELSAAVVYDPLARLSGSLMLFALALACLSVLASLLLSTRLARPLRRLTQAAARIGRGDLITPIAVAPGAEIGTLSVALEEMRRQLLSVTANLHQQQAESQAILTGIVEGVFTVDRERRIQYVNPQAAAMLGVSVEAVRGRFCGDVLNPQGPDGVRPCQDRCPIIHARFQVGARATEHLRLADGRQHIVVITSARRGDDSADGSANDRRQVQVMRDETEVEATRRLRDTILAHISHEFRTPLSAQLASLDLLLDQLPDLRQDQVGELVRSLQRGTLRLTQLIDNLLESVRIEVGQTGMRRRLVSLGGVVEEALEMIRPLLDQRQQSVVVELPKTLPPIWGDAPRLVQVFVNLLANANKYAPAGSAIRIGGDVSNEELTVWVEDQGSGLPDPSGASHFSPFVRSSAAEPEAGGIGLGLWIVKSIVERHGGNVGVQPGGPGTRMLIILPRETLGQ
jgi:signal transduction histidine kinase